MLGRGYVIQNSQSVSQWVSESVSQSVSHEGRYRAARAAKNVKIQLNNPCSAVHIKMIHFVAARIIWCASFYLRFEIHSQERWVLWGGTNLGELNFHYENGPPQCPHSGIHLNGYQHMPRVQEQLTELIFVHFSGNSTYFSEGHSLNLCKME